MSLTDIQNMYLQFLNNFPVSLRPIISIGLAVLIVYSIFKVLKKDWIFLIALVILCRPASQFCKAFGRGLWCLLSFC